MVTKTESRRRGRPPVELPKDANEWIALNLRVPDSFHQRLKMFATESGISMTELIMTATEQLIRRRENAKQQRGG
jgi:predicted HicB family RNase H-like nuclease